MAATGGNPVRALARNNPSVCQSYYAHLADFCVIRSAKNALLSYAKRHDIKQEDTEFDRLARRLLEAILNSKTQATKVFNNAGRDSL